MNSYPYEFLAHPQPLMFVAGLSQGAAASSSTTRDRSSSVISNSSARPSSRRPSHSTLDPNFAAGTVGLSLTSPLTSPRPSQSQLPQSPPAEELADDPIPPELNERDREFEGLLENLRGALAPSGAKSKVYIPEDERKEFRIVLVDKGVRLPLRKIAPPAGSPENTPHSPLSPITASSPLHPDGLIAPVWVRKHAELVPSVFVLFLRLYEPPLPTGEESAEQQEEREAQDKAKEKEMDDALVREIGDRRKRLGERGIKLTVVLMASAATLDSPSLDPRLSYLRRASQLSAKASLFVLTPVPADQLPDFVQSLQDALYDAAMEYYGSHAKRVRRKRARLPTGQFAAHLAPSEKGRPLGAQGWGVRYDWKAGWFAELRKEFDAARRHYEDCWNELAKMFASTQMLPPRTKRWAEAKVLADCVAIRICRLLLYSGESMRVTGPFFVHMKRFSDLSRGWGIGEETFEFWSWIARQYRIFAELLEMAQDAGIKLPPLPLPTFPTAGPPSGPPTPEHWATPVSSANPIHALQQPAFYYYTAATCSVHRKKRYEEALELEQDQAGTEGGGYVSTAPGFANEKKVDHAGLVVELFSKAYSLLKDQEHSSNHTALFVAFKIAETYCQAGQHDMAMKFFERISPTFRKDKWSSIVRQIRTLWYECAQVTGNVETAARLLIEMMCPGSGVEGEDRAALQEDLSLLLRTTAPSSSDPTVIEMDHESLLDVRAGFWGSTVTLPSSAAFQLVIASPEGVDISELAFDELHIGYSDGRSDTVVKANGESTGASSPLILVDGSDNQAPLKWATDGRLIVSGEMPIDIEGEIQISSARLLLRQGAWSIHLVFFPEPLQAWHTSKGSLVPVNGLSDTISVITQPQAIKLEVSAASSAYEGEDCPILVKIISEDERDIDLYLSIFLQPDEDDVESVVRIGEQESKSLLEAIPLGKIAPGSSIEKTVYLKAASVGQKVVDFSLRCTDPGGSADERVQTVSVPVISPFECVASVLYRNAGVKGGEAAVRTTLKANGPGTIIVESLTLKSDNEGEQRLLATSLDPATVPKRWSPNQSFAIHSQYLLESSRRPSLNAVPPPPGHLILTWRSETAPSTTETSFPLPALVLPITDSFVSASLEAPPGVRLHQPFRIPLTINNAHPTHAASVSIEAATAEAFVWTGNRAGELEVPPGETVVLNMDLVAVGMTGWAALPKVSVWEGRGEAERREVKVKQDLGGVYVRP